MSKFGIQIYPYSIKNGEKTNLNNIKLDKTVTLCQTNYSLVTQDWNRSQTDMTGGNKALQHSCRSLGFLTQQQDENQLTKYIKRHQDDTKYHNKKAGYKYNTITYHNENAGYMNNNSRYYSKNFGYKTLDRRTTTLDAMTMTLENRSRTLDTTKSTQDNRIITPDITYSDTEGS